MSPRYYLLTAVLVVVLTFAISFWKQKKTGREIFIVLCQVMAGVVLTIAAVAGLAKLLVMLGVAQSGFF